VLSSDLGGEIVVYDSGQHRAHCLNLPSAIVWRHLDGRTSMAEMIAHLRRELDQPADEEMVRLALEELDRAGLLEEPLAHPAARKVSRRHALRRLGIAAGGGAVLLPAISSIVAPPRARPGEPADLLAAGGGLCHFQLPGRVRVRPDHGRHDRMRRAELRRPWRRPLPEQCWLPSRDGVLHARLLFRSAGILHTDRGSGGHVRGAGAEPRMGSPTFCLSRWRWPPSS